MLHWVELRLENSPNLERMKILLEDRQLYIRRFHFKQIYTKVKQFGTASWPGTVPQEDDRNQDRCEPGHYVGFEPNLYRCVDIRNRRKCSHGPDHGRNRVHGGSGTTPIHEDHLTFDVLLLFFINSNYPRTKKRWVEQRLLNPRNPKILQR